jgi:hypothetical protein
MYVIGGRTYGIGRRAQNDAYDFSTGKWITGFAPLPTLRAGAASAVFGDEIFVIGGEGGGLTYSETEAYDAVTNTWRSLTPIPVARHGIQAALVNGLAYIADGGLKMGGASPTDIQNLLTMSSGPSVKPDARIRLSTESKLVGNNIYDTTGATEQRAVTATSGAVSTFVISIQNDGSVNDTFAVTGDPALAGFDVRYLKGLTGTTDITTKVEAGTYQMANVSPGSSRAIRLVVTNSAISGSVGSWLVSAYSLTDATSGDAVLGKVTIS